MWLIFEFCPKPSILRVFQSPLILVLETAYLSQTAPLCSAPFEAGCR